ncbi:aspartate 1-decarboxylase [Phosphitispora sp. TUW77]|uniref:aspartate 1-decarboxylase n=1 Tax=Phosphitispora sp. TUW77 TaxID=3152361 RepID=UPI003AB66DD4
MLKSKIHRATVTGAELNYVGSITLDETLMKAADILEHEKVQIVNNNNGARFETYVIKGPKDSGTVCLNGAAARLVQPGDSIIIISYVMVENHEATDFRPIVIFVDDKNKISEINSGEIAGEYR